MKKVLSNSIVFLMYLCCISMIFYQVIIFQSVLLIIISSLILILEVEKLKKNSKTFSFFIFFVLITLIYSYDFDVNDSIKKIGEALMLFIIPIISQNHFTKKNKYFNKKK